MLAPAMTTEMRKTGIEVVGDMPWGAHFCLFYETQADLLETLVSYCKAGLQSHEFCLWVVAEPLTEEEARHALKQAIPAFDHYVVDQSIEIVPAREWYLQDGTFDLNRVVSGWNEKLARASDKGYAGVRVTGDTAWLEKKHWKDFCEYEDSLNQAVANPRLSVLCTYPLAKCGAAEILDVVRTHYQEELEQRVVERTSQLTSVNSELIKEVFQHQRAEEALRRSEAYLAEAQRVSHTGSFGWNVSTGNIVWSDETFRIFEFDSAVKPTVELILQRTHPEDRPFVQKTLDQAARDKQAFDFEHRLLMPDGSLKYIRVVGHPSTNDESGSVEFVGAVMDVTVAKQAEDTLRESEAYLAEAQRLSHTGSWASTPATGDIRYWSEECYRVLGFDPHGGQPRFETFFQRIHPDDQRRLEQVERAVETAKRASGDKTGFEFDYRIVHPGGEIREIHTVGHPVFSPSGRSR
jgi:PAS domain-containing protein